MVNIYPVSVFSLKGLLNVPLSLYNKTFSFVWVINCVKYGTTTAIEKQVYNCDHLACSISRTVTLHFTGEQLKCGQRHKLTEAAVPIMYQEVCS